MKTNTSLAFLNWGQSFIFTIGLTSIMLLASQQILAGACSLFLLVLILSFPFCHDQLFKNYFRNI